MWQDSKPGSKLEFQIRCLIIDEMMKVVAILCGKSKRLDLELDLGNNRV